MYNNNKRLSFFLYFNTPWEAKWEERYVDRACEIIKNNTSILNGENNPSQEDIAKAHYDFGNRYRYNSGFRMDPQASLKHYKEAAELGHAEAAYELLKFYLGGNEKMGITIDLETAKHIHSTYLEKAKNVGKDFASNNEYIKKLEDMGEVVDFEIWRKTKELSNRFK